MGRITATRTMSRVCMLYPSLFKPCGKPPAAIPNLVMSEIFINLMHPLSPNIQEYARARVRRRVSVRGRRTSRVNFRR